MLPASEYSLARSKIHLYQLIVFENSHFSLVAIRRDHHFLGHLVLRVPGRGGRVSEGKEEGVLRLQPAG